jgi:hypothetical protein
MVKVLCVISIILLISTLICGLWIASNKSSMDVKSLSASVKFHMQIAITTVVLTAGTLVMVLIKYRSSK